MVIIDSEESKSPRGPRPAAPQALAPPPYVPLSPGSSAPLLPPRSPGVRSTPSPFSAPPSNYLTIKRERADITGSWNINTALPLPPPHHGRSFSSGSDRESDLDAASETGTNTGTDSSATQPSIISSATSASIQTPNRPNLKLFSPRGKIDAAIRVSGAPRAWIETVSRDEDVALTFPPNPSGAPRPPIRLLARSTSGSVQVHLPYPFMGTLRVPSETVLPPSLRSQSVVLSPSEPPIDRPPILDESPVKTKLGSIPSRAVTPTPPSPPSPPTRQSLSESTRPQSPETPASPPPILENVPRIETPLLEAPPATVTIVEPRATGARADSEPMVTVTAPEAAKDVAPSTAEQPLSEPTISPDPLVQSPGVEVRQEILVAPTSPPAETQAPPTPSPTPLSPTLSPPSSPSPETPSTSGLFAPALPPRSPSRSSHHRSPSVSSTLPAPAPAQHDSAESSTIYFIGDYLHSGYDTNAPDDWVGDEFVIDSEDKQVRVCWYGEKADVPWTEDVTGRVKDAIDWNRWKSPKGLRGMAGMAMPKMSVSSLGRRFKFGK